MHTMLGDAIMDTLHRATRNGFTVRFADLSEGVWITIIDSSRERETSLFLTPENYDGVVQRLEAEYANATQYADQRASSNHRYDTPGSIPAA